MLVKPVGKRSKQGGGEGEEHVSYPRTCPPPPPHPPTHTPDAVGLAQRGRSAQLCQHCQAEGGAVVGLQQARELLGGQHALCVGGWGVGGLAGVKGVLACRWGEGGEGRGLACSRRESLGGRHALWVGGGRVCGECVCMCVQKEGRWLGAWVGVEGSRGCARAHSAPQLEPPARPPPSPTHPPAPTPLPHPPTCSSEARSLSSVT